jgi:hypothetical protein
VEYLQILGEFVEVFLQKIINFMEENSGGKLQFFEKQFLIYKLFNKMQDLDSLTETNSFRGRKVTQGDCISLWDFCVFLQNVTDSKCVNLPGNGYIRIPIF